MRIYLLAGEASGDIHGADLIKVFKHEYPACTIRAMGGNEMRKKGAQIAFEYSSFSIMGFVEVVKNYRKIRHYFKKVEADIRLFDPDFIVFIDFPGFNLRLAKSLYLDFPLHYYIAPKAWAWNKRRVKSLKKYMKSVSCILPFEEAFFRQFDVNAKYIGNPSLEQVDSYIKNEPKVKVEDEYVAIFPGSRKQEIDRILPVMLESIRKFPELSYKISKAPNLPKHLYDEYLNKSEDLIEDNYLLLKHAKIALVTSGTATLETALFGIPQVVCYIANPVSYFIAKRLVKLKYISLVNLILDKPVVIELIQERCNEKNIHLHLAELLQKEKFDEIQMNYILLREKLGNKRASAEVVSFISNSFN